MKAKIFKNKPLLIILLIIILIIIIFLLSHESNSSRTTYSIIESLFPNINNYELLSIFNFIIRKAAHITEYLVLTFLLITILKKYLKEEKKVYIISIILCFMFASIDEIHQAFIPGRTSQFIDVIIDTTGGLLSVFIYYILLRRRDKNE